MAPRSSPEPERVRDVVVVGGGNAGLNASLVARAEGADVLLLERAPLEMRAGNSRHTRNLRFSHDGTDPYTPGPYTTLEFLADLRDVTCGEADEDLAALLVERSRALPEWLESHGVRWQPPLEGTLQLERTNRFFLGGGKAMMDAYYASAERSGVEVVYEAGVRSVSFDGRRISLGVESDGHPRNVFTRAAVFAAGGFEANIGWLERYWGAAARNYIVRGSPFNDGTVLSALYELGALPAGDPREFHGVAVDARSPKFDGGVVTRVDSIPFGIVVDRKARRFYDEGEDIWPKRYAIWGSLIAEQEDQIAYSIFDRKAMGLFREPPYPPVTADTLAGLAVQLDLGPDRLAESVRSYNAACLQQGPPDRSRADGRRTEGLKPPKSNWAVPIEAPPFFAYPLRPGITFTYGGVRVDDQARILAAFGDPLPWMYAAGEIMAGNILTRGYLAGVGLTIGAVFGQLAGRAAARTALSHENR